MASALLLRQRIAQQRDELVIERERIRREAPNRDAQRRSDDAYNAAVSQSALCAAPVAAAAPLARRLLRYTREREYIATVQRIDAVSEEARRMVGVTGCRTHGAAARAALAAVLRLAALCRPVADACGDAGAGSSDDTAMHLPSVLLSRLAFAAGTLRGHLDAAASAALVTLRWPQSSEHKPVLGLAPTDANKSAATEDSVEQADVKRAAQQLQWSLSALLSLQTRLQQHVRGSGVLQLLPCASYGNATPQDEAGAATGDANGVEDAAGAAGAEGAAGAAGALHAALGLLGLGAGAAAPRVLWAFVPLLRPIRRRFAYHFSRAASPTCRLDRPEWFFGYLLQVARWHAPFLDARVQPLLAVALGAEGASDPEANSETDIDVGATVNADADAGAAATAELHPRVELICHAVSEAMAFDEGLDDAVDYSAYCFGGSNGADSTSTSADADADADAGDDDADCSAAQCRRLFPRVLDVFAGAVDGSACDGAADGTAGAARHIAIPVELRAWLRAERQRTQHRLRRALRAAGAWGAPPAPTGAAGRASGGAGSGSGTGAAQGGVASSCTFVAIELLRDVAARARRLPRARGSSRSARGPRCLLERHVLAPLADAFCSVAAVATERAAPLGEALGRERGQASSAPSGAGEAGGGACLCTVLNSVWLMETALAAIAGEMFADSGTGDGDGGVDGGDGGRDDVSDGNDDDVVEVSTAHCQAGGAARDLGAVVARTAALRRKALARAVDMVVAAARRELRGQEYGAGFALDYAAAATGAGGDAGQGSAGQVAPDDVSFRARDAFARLEAAAAAARRLLAPPLHARFWRRLALGAAKVMLEAVRTVSRRRAMRVPAKQRQWQRQRQQLDLVILFDMLARVAPQKPQSGLGTGTDTAFLSKLLDDTVQAALGSD
eukprot:g7356.t1